MFFDTFRQFSRRAKSVKNRQKVSKKLFDTFRQFSRGTFFPTPFAIRPFCLFWSFWDFPDFSGIVRGFSRFVLFLFIGLLTAPARNTPERVCGPFPKTWESPRFGNPRCSPSVTRFHPNWSKMSMLRSSECFPSQRAENGALDVLSLDLHFGAPDFQSRGPKTLILKGFIIAIWGKILGRPKMQIQRRRIQCPILSPPDQVGGRGGAPLGGWPSGAVKLRLAMISLDLQAPWVTLLVLQILVHWIARSKTSRCQAFGQRTLDKTVGLAARTSQIWPRSQQILLRCRLFLSASDRAIEATVTAKTLIARLRVFCRGGLVEHRLA